MMGKTIRRTSKKQRKQFKNNRKRRSVRSQQNEDQPARKDKRVSLYGMDD